MIILVELNMLPAKNAVLVQAQGFGLAGYGPTEDIAIKSLIRAVRTMCKSVESTKKLEDELLRRRIRYERREEPEIVVKAANIAA